MKKIITGIILVAGIITLAGCQSIARNFGGDITLELDPGLKLEEITWKEDNLWYLTRPMREGEFPETHVFNQSSEFGVLEGSVTVIECLDEEENHD